ncbi:probable L-type lectin-domain containing receptor kinase S.5 [Rhododendron vialii]|uniref:probable L-type lectin-domain containing receptor kinase S.5 n=1 Tax=Rhododendron vialii TaxID=182163 RepID=UPI00265F8C85|nr:probable L-type lectin-domain containing receptor kinase S.5 [Rhododendron vialii]
MGLAATYVMLIPLLLSLFAAMPPATAKLKTSNITAELQNNKIRCNYLNTHKLGKAFQVDLPTTIHNDAIQVTLDSVNSDFLIINQTRQILYESPFKLWEGQNDTDRVASFSSSFLVNLNGVDNSTPDIVLTSRTLKEDIDPNSNHVGLNINGVRSDITTSFTTFGLQLVGEGTTANFFNVWVQYEGIKKLIAVYVAQQNETDLTPSRPVNPILTSYLHLRGVENLHLYFGFSASKENATQLNRVRQWNLTLTVEYNHHVNWLKIGLIVGITTAVLLPASVALVYYSRKRWLLRRSDRQMSRKVKSMPGMPREYRYKDLQKATNNFDETRKLGQGGCGVVYKGYLANQQDLEVAVKMFPGESLKGQDDFFQELTIINQLRHKYLVPLLGWCHKNGELLLVYDYMPNGSLDKHLFNDADSTPLSWNLRRKIISGVASALHYLHYDYQKRVVHRDLKASNIMLDAEFNARLGDFGLARVLDNEKTSYIEANGVPGTRGYMAPEYVFTGKATEQSDVYAFGAVILEVVCGRRPEIQIGTYPLLVDWVWALHRQGQLLEAVDNRLGENNVAEEAQRFLLLGLACSHPTASERPKTQEIVQMLSGSVPVPYVPPVRPPYMLPLVPIGEEDISQATTTDTTSFMTAHYGSVSAPVAINPEIQRPDSDSHINII